MTALDLKYSELLELNRELETSLENDSYQAVVLSNITVFQLKEILEVTIRAAGMPIAVRIGDYDNIVQDSSKYADAALVVIFWETCNLVDGLQYRIEAMEETERAALMQRFITEFDLVCQQLSQTSLVLFNRFTVAAFGQSSPRDTALDKLTTELNDYAASRLPQNFRLVDLDDIVTQTGLANCYNLRNYYSSKALYTVDFLRNYATAIEPYIRSASGRAKKVLVFDCDNTLWQGILGEDGADGIAMGQDSRTGRYFHEVQTLALGLHREGVLLGICSKNNAAEVDDVLENHADMVLRNEHFAIKRVNWSDKASNIRDIAQELNVGLDSIVFVDDSPFEADIVRQQLPGVTVLQVPGKLQEYPMMMRNNTGLFYNLSVSNEDRNKTAMYKAQAARNAEQSTFESLQDYLASLGLSINIYTDNIDQLARLSQLSLKTNQFNLTTRRYTEADMEKFLRADDYKVFSFDVSDKFGGYGITGLCIVKIDLASQSAAIDTLLMSCRIIGRNIELAFMDYLVAYLKRAGIDNLQADYVETSKNSQVNNFYTERSFQPTGSMGKEHHFVLKLSSYIPSDTHYIEVIDESGT